MAIMIPSVISPEVKSSAERKIFEWFQNAPGTDKWIVLHSLGITTHNKVIYGETDFLVLAPKLGLFSLFLVDFLSDNPLAGILYGARKRQ